MKKVIVVNGPNLNKVGVREKDIYGSLGMDSFISQLKNEYAAHLNIEYFQSNHEGQLIDFLQGDFTDYCGIVINLGAYTHTSLALADTLAIISVPIVEVHISNIYAREVIRQNSLTASKCVGVITGLGLYGYKAALQFLLSIN